MKFYAASMKTSLLFFALAISQFLSAQNSGLNQLDKDGKKDGKWVVYLDKNWKRMDDSSTAIYCRYTYYDHGTNIIPMGECGGSGFRLEKTGITTAATSNSKLLNGEYTWFDDKGILSSVHNFYDGEYISCKEYFNNGQVNQHFDYTKGCAGEAHSWTVYIYDKSGQLTQSLPTCKDKNGKWPKMKG